MSSIIDALKKTQSAINNNPYPDHSMYGDIELPNQNKHINNNSLNTNKNISFLTKMKNKLVATLSYQKIFWTILMSFLAGGIWLGYHYDRQITNETAAMGNKIEQAFLATPKATLTAPLKKTTLISKTTPPKLILNGTIRAGRNRDALINNKLYHTGELIDGYEIINIDYNHVTLIDPITHNKITLQTDLS